MCLQRHVTSRTKRHNVNAVIVCRLLNVWRTSEILFKLIQEYLMTLRLLVPNGSNRHHIDDDDNIIIYVIIIIYINNNNNNNNNKGDTHRTAYWQ